jgi:Arc/MetJ family transcription regulator
MRTNIVIDDELMTKAKRLSGLETKREVVETALREFIRRRDQQWLLDMIGSDPDAEIDADDDRCRTE